MRVRKKETPFKKIVQDMKDRGRAGFVSGEQQEKERRVAESFKGGKIPRGGMEKTDAR